MTTEWAVFICFIAVGIIATLIIEVPKIGQIALKVLAVLLAIVGIIYFIKITLDLIYAITHLF